MLAVETGTADEVKGRDKQALFAPRQSVGRAAAHPVAVGGPALGFSWQVGGPGNRVRYCTLVISLMNERKAVGCGIYNICE